MQTINFYLIFLLWPLNCHCRQNYELTRRNNTRKDKDNSLKVTATVAAAVIPARSFHLGYVYDDADDVIHIIEPPQHFQELKRRQKQQKIKPAPKNVARPIKVKELKHAAANSAAQSRRQRKPIMPDMLTKATTQVVAQSRAEDLQVPPLVVRFPMEILASVRQTERILQKHQQQKHRPHAVKQRIKTQQTHTVITEQGFERSHFKRGKEQRVGGGNSHAGYQKVTAATAAKRVRRALKNDTKTTTLTTTTTTTPQPAPTFETNMKQGAELLLRLSALLKNATLYLPDDTDTDETAVNVIEMPQKNLLHELRTRFQQQNTPKELIGEIEPTATSDYQHIHQRQRLPILTSTLVENDIFNILERSLNATDALMQQIMRKYHNKLKVGLACNQQTLIEAGDSLQQYQSKIDCMRQQLEAVHRSSKLPKPPLLATKILATTTTSTVAPTSITARGHRRFGARSANKFGSTATTLPQPPPTTTTSSIIQNPNLVAAVRQSQRLNKKSTGQLATSNSNRNRIEPHSTIIKTKARKTASQLLDAHNVSAAAAALLYDDVMTNIRNMLEAKDLKLLVSSKVSEAAQTKTSTDEAFDIDDFIEASSSSNPTAENYFRDLNLYISGLQQMLSRHVPHMTSASILPHELARARTGEGDGNGNGALNASSDWYFINDEGEISQTSFDLKLPSTTVLFRSFPDIPNAAFYIQNHATHLATAASKNESDFEFN